MSADPTRRPTLKDVAALAKVDASLVSRVLNNDARLVITAETRDRVLKAVKAIGYRKNLVAQGLKTGRTQLLGYIVPDLHNPSYSQIIAGAQRRAAEDDYTVLIANLPGGRTSATAFRRLLDEGRVDGLLVASAIIGDVNTESLLAGGGPVVVVNRLVPGAACAVVPDDAAAGRVAAKYLVELGHRHCAIVTGPPELETSDRRRAAFESAISEAGLPKVFAIRAPGWDAAAGWTAAQQLFAAKRRITAVYATAGLVHVGLLAAAAERGIAVPDELSVIALNDNELNQFTSPPTTAIKMPLEQLGAVAVDLLLRRVSGEVTPATMVVTEPSPELVIRGSVAAPPK